MNVDDIVLRVQRQFGDESSVQIDESDIIRWINDAQNDIAVQNELMQATGTLASIADQNEYQFPLDMLAMRSLYYNGLRLKYLPRQEWDEYINKADPTEIQSGTPEFYSRWGGWFIVYPKPNAAVASSFKLLYHKRPNNVITGGVLSLPLEYHTRIVEYCLQKAYETDEDWDAAAAKATQFDAGLSILKENAQNPDKQYYPTVTTLPDDQW